MRGAPMQPTSSSYDSAKWIGSRRRARSTDGTSASDAAMKPFMSHVPRPYSLPSRTSGANGSLLQRCPSTGTTSVWPDSTIPPCTPPSAAGTVANRLALSRPSLYDRCVCRPRPCRWSRTVSISARLEPRLVVSKLTSLRVQSSVESAVAVVLMVVSCG